MNRPFAWLLGLLLTACSPTGEQVRERSSWNDDWKFALSDSVQDYSSPDSDDSTWRILSLPHDWSIEGDFSLDNPSTPGGGALPGGIGWYRKTFTLPETDRGKVVYVDEKLMDGIVCASGSSPAYVYMFIEAMADSVVKYGIKRDDAYKLVAQTVLGSAKMVLESGEHPAVLKDKVCSPGGTTIQAVSALEENGFRNALIKATDACYDKCTSIK